MIKPRLVRRRSSERTRIAVTKWVARLETLESRVVLSNGLVGVPAQFTGPQHLVSITSVPEDPDNDGIVSSQSLTIVGQIERPNLEDFTDTHSVLTLNALQGGNVIGTVSWDTANPGTPAFRQDPGAPYRALFELPVTLASATSDPQNITFQIVVAPYGTRNFVLISDSTQLLTGTFVVDTEGPTVAQVGPLATEGTGTVSTVDVTFSEAIDPASFTRDDLALTLGGNPVTLGTGVGVVQVNATTFQVYGLRVPTAAPGAYELTVNAAGVADLIGNAGTGSGSTTFTVVAPPPNGVVGVAGLIASPSHDFVVTSIPQDGDNNGVINTQSVEFLGFVERANRGDFTDTHTQITIEAVQGGSVIGSVAFGSTDFSQDGTRPYRANFRLPATLLSNAATPQDVTFRVIVDPYGSRDVLLAADSTQVLTATLVVDSGPTIASISPVTSPRNTPVASIDVTFSEAIDPATFTTADVSLTRNGVAVPLSGLSFTSADDTTFTIGNLSGFTGVQGAYVLAVDASGVNDALGNAGSGSQSTSFLVDTTRPTVLPLPTIPKSQSPLSTIDVAFSEAINPATFTTADLRLERLNFDLTTTAIPLDPAVGVVTFSSTDNIHFTISGLEAFTAIPQSYRFSVVPSGIMDPAGNAGTGVTQRTFFEVAAGPFIASIGPAAVPSTAPVSSLLVTFSEPVQTGSFDLSAVSLQSLDFATWNPFVDPPVLGTTLPFGPEVTLVQVNATTFRVDGLSTATAPDGNFTLTVDASNVRTATGESFVGTDSYFFSVVPGNGVVGVGAAYMHDVPSPKPHRVLITEVPEDPDNDGRIASRSATLVGQIWRAEAGEDETFTDTHVLLIITAYQEDASGVLQKVGEITWNTSTPGTPEFQQGDPATQPNYAFFRLPVTLLSAGADLQSLTFEVAVEPLVPGPRYGSRDVLHYQDYGTVGSLLTATFTVDTVGPSVATISPVDTPRTTPVSSVNVTFGEAINPATFTTDDLRLTRDGQVVALANLSITTSDNTTFAIGGLETYTAEVGAYVLTVDASGVQDLVGNPGSGTQQVAFTVAPMSVSGPQIVNLQRYGFHAQPTELVLTFDRELNEATAENTSNYVIVNPGRDNRLGTADDVTVPISSATYDAAARTVTLRPANRLALFVTHGLLARGIGEGAITDRDGSLLDGDADGVAGGDFTTSFSREILAGPSVTVMAARRIRQPLPSRPVFTPVTRTPIRRASTLPAGDPAGVPQTQQLTPGLPMFATLSDRLSLLRSRLAGLRQR